MTKGIVRLEDMPSTITVSELPRVIIVPNPRDRKVVITPEESGIDKEQVFTSDCLPDEIPYRLIWAVRYPRSIRYYPRYVANVVTSQKLKLALIKEQEATDDGIAIYDIEWRDATYEYDFEISTSGEVLQYDKDKIND